MNVVEGKDSIMRCSAGRLTFDQELELWDN
jgi:hypothetical protein